MKILLVGLTQASNKSVAGVAGVGIGSTIISLLPALTIIGQFIAMLIGLTAGCVALYLIFQKTKHFNRMKDIEYPSDVEMKDIDHVVDVEEVKDSDLIN